MSMCEWDKTTTFFYNKLDEYKLIDHYKHIIKKTNESQGHGKTMEKSIQTKIFGMTEEEIETYKNTAPHDIRKEHNRLTNKALKEKNISIKTACSDTICCGKISRFINDSLEASDKTIMIASKLVQINLKQKEVTKTYLINIHEMLSKFKDNQELKKDILDFENYIHNLPKGKISKDYLIKGKELENKYPDIFKLVTINIKVDSKTQRRVQCSIDINKINKYIIKVFEGAKVYDKEYCGLIYSPPRERNSLTIDRMRKFAKSKEINGPGKRGGWSNMKKEEILSYIISKGYSEDGIKNFQEPY